ncbi:hypothetical protein B0H99_105225 [Planomicrobium soli]|uniref:Uncharacterized protein n=1 Tax=Planomicrobium soli TaxID=1176648 RepID=A0A2P8H2K6_9BACL|nr:hypothetical protein [Planomicrobium soli]PSL40447.1 hypothetical protein B0H99_105225 [Planomicrobium soli]
MKKGDHEGEELIPRVEPHRDTPPSPEQDFDLLPNKELEYKENSNQKYRDTDQNEDSDK